jgi:hypothetical protein
LRVSRAGARFALVGIMSLFAIVSRPTDVARAARLLASETVAGASKHAALLVFGDPVSFATAVVLSMLSSVRQRDAAVDGPH